MLYYVYKLTNTINGKIYVGKSYDPHKRFKIHVNIANGGKQIYGDKYQVIHKAINKYGADNFQLEIIDQSEQELESLEKEKFWISYFKNSNAILYNSTDGGDGISGYKHSKKSKLKMSENHTYKYGKEHHLFGIGHSQETKDKISRLNKGKLVGDKNPMYGKCAENSPCFGRKGDKHPNTKISDEDLITLKQELLTNCFTLKQLAEKYKVSITLISNIKNNKART